MISKTKSPAASFDAAGGLHLLPNHHIAHCDLISFCIIFYENRQVKAEDAYRYIYLYIIKISCIKWSKLRKLFVDHPAKFLPFFRKIDVDENPILCLFD